MYASLIGKKFLEYYNSKNKTSLTTKEYFDKVFFPLFYDREKYLFSPANTPLFQLVTRKKTADAEERKKSKDQIHKKISEYLSNKDSPPEMSFAIGFQAADDTQITSGQVTSLKIPMTEDDIYGSWIGIAFGIGMKGGINLLIDHPLIYEALETGWSVYSKYIDENPEIGNKVPSWNGIWLSHYFSSNYDKNDPIASFSPLKLGKDGKPELELRSWVNILFVLSKNFSGQNIVAYAYSLGQQNVTLGFTTIAFPEIRRLSDYFSTLFGSIPVVANKKLEMLYEAQYNFNIAFSKFSRFGVRAFEPKDLRKFIPSPNQNKFPGLKSDENSIINYFIYETWIIAMLNNTDLLLLADKTANELIAFVDNETKARTNRSNAVNNLLSARNRKDFVRAMDELIQIDPALTACCEELLSQIMLNISQDNIPFFVTLLSFKYHSKKTNINL